MSVGQGGLGPGRVYDRIARFYDLFETPMDRMGGARRRQRILSRAEGRVLEVGIGTGINLERYANDVRLVGVDISPRMLERARRRARIARPGVALEIADIEALPHPNETFDAVTATCVFCSVADPIRGLREVRRVIKPSGRVLLLEHVRPRTPGLGKLFDMLSPISRRFIGPEINRRTEENVVMAGLEIIRVRREGIWREIEARRTR